jgi:hypothetical protein
MTGRDYGVDMQCEVFADGAATGRTLLLQIKGTSTPSDESGRPPHVDLPIKTIRYAELFGVPFLLCLCPVTLEPPMFHFLWVQEYVRVVLNFVRPEWRLESGDIRLHFPTTNTMPGKEGKLAFISGQPARQAAIGQLARIQHELRNSVSLLEEQPEAPARERITECADLLREAAGLDALISEPNWRWGRVALGATIEQAINAVRSLDEGPPYADDELEAAGYHPGDHDEDQSARGLLLQSVIRSAPDRLSALVAIFNDDRLRHTLWTASEAVDF